MKICVYGAGAIGGLIAAWLSRSGHDVSVVARGAQLEAIRKEGLRVRDRASGKVESFKVATSASGPQDYVIVALKAQNLTEVQIQKLLGEETSIVTAMNGVPWWFFDRLQFGNGKHRLESLDPNGSLARAMSTRASGSMSASTPTARPIASTSRMIVTM